MSEILEKEIIFKRKSTKKFVYLDKYEDKIKEIESKFIKLNKQLNIFYIILALLLFYIVFN